MRVLLIDVNCKYSSTGKIVYSLYEHLRSNGHEAAVCYGRGEMINEPNIYKFGLDLETGIHAGLARITGLNGCYSPLSTKRLIKYIDEFNPDVIHIHELHAYFVNIKPLIKYIKSKGIRVIWTFHCEYMYTGKCGYAYDCKRYQMGCGKCPAVRDYPTSLLFDRTSKMFKDKSDLLADWDFTIVTPSQWLKDRVKTSFLANKRTELIHNGIDTTTFFLRDTDELLHSHALDNKKIILSVAPNIMDNRKGGAKVLELSQRPEMEDYQFVLVGANENSRPYDNVLMVSQTKDQDELAKWYSSADVFLICSKRENFPTTCIEAYCCGAPVVGFDEGGTAETVPTPYGLFVSDESLDELSDAIKAQVAQQYNKEKIAMDGQASYSQAYMYERYMALYQEENNG